MHNTGLTFYLQSHHMKYVSRPVRWQPATGTTALSRERAFPAYAGDAIQAVISTPTIRVHKSWRVAFIVLIIVTKVLLGFCAYFYLRAEMAAPATTPQPVLHATP